MVHKKYNEDYGNVFDVYILNTGKGNDFHGSKKIKNNIIISKGIMFYQNVSYDKFSKYLEFLLKINNSNVLYKPEYFYTIANVYLSSDDNYSNKFFYDIECQNSHNCSIYLFFMSLYVFIKIEQDKLKDTNTTLLTSDIFNEILYTIKFKLLLIDLNKTIKLNTIFINTSLKYNEYYEYLTINN